MTDQTPDLYAHLEQQQRVAEAADQENAELVAYLRNRGTLLNAEIRFRDVEIARLRARVAELEGADGPTVVRETSDAEPADDPSLEG